MKENKLKVGKERKEKLRMNEIQEKEIKPRDTGKNRRNIKGPGRISCPL